MTQPYRTYRYWKLSDLASSINVGEKTKAFLESAETSSAWEAIYWSFIAPYASETYVIRTDENGTQESAQALLDRRLSSFMREWDKTLYEAGAAYANLKGRLGDSVESSSEAKTGTSLMPETAEFSDFQGTGTDTLAELTQSEAVSHDPMGTPVQRLDEVQRFKFIEAGIAKDFFRRFALYPQSEVDGL